MREEIRKMPKPKINNDLCICLDYFAKLRKKISSSDPNFVIEVKGVTEYFLKRAYGDYIATIIAEMMISMKIEEIEEFHNYFYMNYNKMPQLMVGSLVGVSYKIFKTGFVCMNQYDTQLQTSWFDNYKLSSLKLESNLNDPAWDN